ncbi:MAG: flagellar motor switch protein FliG [Magnetovibrio sp.]|nr:flagellar motor switch protein FliG [Magnetovibrio sp.]
MSATKSEIKDDVKAISGPEKAAIFMLSLTDDHAAAIWDLFDEDEIREISVTMSTLGQVSSTLVEKLLVEFAGKMSGTGTIVGSYEATQRLLTRFMSDDRVSQVMDEIRGPAGRTMWEKLGNVNEAVLANYLKNEYPQTVAVVLSKIRPDHAASVLALLPENFAMEVIIRMLSMEAVSKEILDHVEKTLRTEFMTNLARSARQDSHEMIAGIFNTLDRNTESRFMDALDERNRESAERIKALMFTFDDLERVDSAGVQVILRQVDKAQLAVALKGGSEAVKDLFFSNMSERAAKIMREDMDAMGAVRLKDVDEAQAAVVTTAKELADSNEIIIAGSGEEDELVY